MSHSLSHFRSELFLRVKEISFIRLKNVKPFQFIISCNIMYPRASIDYTKHNAFKVDPFFNYAIKVSFVYPE